MYNQNYKVELPQFPDREVSIAEYGAKSGDLQIETGRHNAEAINRAIREVSEQGGGMVRVPAGIWAVAPIRLFSGVNLHLDSQAMLKFIKSKEDYPLRITSYEGQDCIRTVSPVTAENAENIAITGDGIIDGSGDKWRPVKKFKMTAKQWDALFQISPYVIETKETEIWMPTESILEGNRHNIQGTTEEALAAAAPYYDFYRPVMVSLRYCKKVLLQGATFMNSPAWNIHPYFCEDLTVDGVKIRNPYFAQNGDGIDVESCTNVHIHHSTFETGDDAICMKSGKNAIARRIEGPCSNVYIHDCLVNEGHGGFVIGSEFSGGMKNLVVRNNTFQGTDAGLRFKSSVKRGGTSENIFIDHIYMTDITGDAITFETTYWDNHVGAKKQAAPVKQEYLPNFQDIHMSDIYVRGCKNGIVAHGAEGMVHDITVKNAYIFYYNQAQDIDDACKIKLDNVHFATFAK